MRPRNEPVKVLLAETNPADVLMIREALKLQQMDFELWVQYDGEQMMRCIDRLEADELPRPDVVLLNLDLPRAGGEGVLERVRRSEKLGDVPIVIVTSSDTPEERERTARLGAAQYFRKPADYEAFMHLGAVIKGMIARS